MTSGESDIPAPAEGSHFPGVGVCGLVCRRLLPAPPGGHGPPLHPVSRAPELRAECPRGAVAHGLPGGLGEIQTLMKQVWGST